MALSPEEVSRIAALACIDLTPEETTEFAGQLDVILSAVARVSQAETDGVPPMSHALPLVNVFRADEVRESLSAEAVLAGAPATELDRFRVPRILGEAK